MPTRASGAGAATLAGLPPTIGFVSEWFILEALMQQFRLPGLALRLGLAGAGALVELTTGLAALAFLRVLGLTFLGTPPRSLEKSQDTGVFGKLGMSALGASCLALAAVTPWEIRYIAHGLAPIVPHADTIQALKSPWVLQPVFHGFSIQSPSWLWVAMPTMFAAALGAVSRPVPAGAPSPGLALGHVGRRRPLELLRIRVRQPFASRPR